jgi:hypothetical protein
MPITAWGPITRSTASSHGEDRGVLRGRLRPPGWRVISSPSNWTPTPMPSSADWTAIPGTPRGASRPCRIFPIEVRRST